MKKLIVAFHSMVDLITNSSTEQFCAVKGKTEDAVRSILNKILEEADCTVIEFSVDQHYVYDEETDEETVPPGEFQISCDQGGIPCKLLLDKIKSVFEVVKEGE